MNFEISSVELFRKRAGTFLLISFTAAVLSSCCYRMNIVTTGDAKTYSVAFFENKASIVNPVLSQIFTEKLKDKIRRESRLQVVQDAGDFSYSGHITNYSVSPAGIQNEDQASLNRLTITVNVKFENRLDAKQNFEQAFTQFSDFEGSRSLAEVESALIDEITDKLIQDILNRTINNW